MTCFSKTSNPLKIIYSNVGKYTYSHKCKKKQRKATLFLPDFCETQILQLCELNESQNDVPFDYVSSITPESKSQINSGVEIELRSQYLKLTL